VQQPPQAPERAQADGVPVHFAELPGAFSAALMFRTGRSDEPLGSCGISHLIEHLALFALGNPVHSYNGFVDLTRTVFYASGTRDEVAAFLRDVSAALAGLPLDRLQDERRVLKTELAAVDPGFYGRMFSHRFGAAGPGLLNYHDLGLNWLDADAVSAWAAERYTRANAVIWMSGPPPEALELPLPDGERIAAPVPEQLPGFTEPRYLAEGAGGAGVSMVGRRSTAITCALRLAAERSVKRLRVDQGISYSIGSDYLPLDADRGHLILSADCLDEHAAPVVGGLLGVLEELGGGGATDDELALDLRRIRDAMAEPDWMRSELDRAASDELHGWPSMTSAEFLAESEALTPATVGAELSDALTTRLVIAPEGVPAPPGHGSLEASSEPPVEGREFVPRRGLSGRRQAVRLIAGEEGITLIQPDEEPITVRFGNIAAAVHERPGQITLIARDASFIEFEFGRLRDGDELERLVLDRLPPPGAVPGPAFEAARAVDAIAERDLERRWGVSDELTQLGGALRDGESLEHLALASQGHRAGLLAVTDRRVMWLYDGVRSDIFWETPREAIANVASSSGVPGLRAARLRLEIPDGELKVSVDSRDKFGDIVAELSPGSG
jgi:predicted Zn-dependent peptidase